MSLVNGTHATLATALTLALSLGTGSAGGGPGAGTGAPEEWGGTDEVRAAPRDDAAVATEASARDTVFPVSRGSHLVLRDLQGEVRVETWDEPRVRIHAGRDEGVVFRIEGGERRVVRPADPGERERHHDYRVTVPAWIGLTVQGRSVDVVVEGVEGGVEVRTISGDVTVRRATGTIQARSVEGELRVEDSRGRIQLRSLGDDVSVLRVGGTVQVETTDGDLRLLDVEAAAVQASTMDGDIEFSGPVRGAGRYVLTTHDGDISLGVVGELGARVSVSTFDGSFESDFPVVTERYQSGRELRFTVGGGGAELVLRAFDGEIRLRRSR